jgi:competence ComEA-like helix-hairpin-helix protein
LIYALAPHPLSNVNVRVLSIYFYVLLLASQVELMNVNMATEEELMTLAGVNRTLARNIINHRNLIGWYRKVDDLALVSGMGATKLDLIRPEICISSRRKNLR